MAYLGHRLDKISKFAWESGKNLPEHVLEKMSPAEMLYFKKYLEAIENYNKNISESLAADAALADDDNDLDLDQAAGGFDPSSLDLTVDFAPPKDLFIEVRVNKDYGTVMLPESGEVKLQKNSTHLLRRAEVEHLIKRGIMTEVL